MHSPTTPQTRLTTQTMRATVYTDYGLPRDVLRMTEVERPVPDADGLLIRVHAASVNALDWRLITGTPFLARISDGIRKAIAPYSRCRHFGHDRGGRRRRGRVLAG